MFVDTSSGVFLGGLPVVDAVKNVEPGGTEEHGTGCVRGSDGVEKDQSTMVSLRIPLVDAWYAILLLRLLMDPKVEIDKRVPVGCSTIGFLGI